MAIFICNLWKTWDKKVVLLQVSLTLIGIQELITAASPISSLAVASAGVLFKVLSLLGYSYCQLSFNS